MTSITYVNKNFGQYYNATVKKEVTTRSNESKAERLLSRGFYFGVNGWDSIHLLYKLLLCPSDQSLHPTEAFYQGCYTITVKTSCAFMFFG